MESETPTWLTKEFIKHALENGREPLCGSEVTVERIEVDKPIAKGENYVCQIFRVKTDYRKSDKSDELLNTSLIVKTPKRGSTMFESLIKTGTIQKEVRIYNEYVPKLNKILGENGRLTPKSFHSSEEYVIVLEDLNVKGFVMADRRKQLDYDHCVITLKTLAKFHAASVRLHETNPELVEGVGSEVHFHESKKVPNREFGKINFKMLAAACKNTPELSRYTEKLIGYSEKTWDKLVELMKPKDNYLNVLNHGDFWVNNMMFRYVDNKPIDVKLIDLQVSRYAVPALDLLCFLNGSVQEDVRLNKYDDMLNVYLEELNLNLENFGSSKRLLESDLQKMMNESEFFGMFISFALLPVIIGNPEDITFNAKGLTEDDYKDPEKNPLAGYYKSKRYLKLIAVRLSEFEKNGWF